MAWAPAQTVECPFEEPVLIRLSIGIANWWLYDGDLVVREDALAKCIFAVPLFEGAAAFDRQAD